MSARSESAARILRSIPPAASPPSEINPLLRELLESVRSLKASIESMQSPDMFESLTRKQTAELLKIHPRQLEHLELLGLPFYRVGKGHTYVRHEVLAFRETLRSMRGLELKIAKPRSTKLATDHSGECSTRKSLEAR